MTFRNDFFVITAANNYYLIHTHITHISHYGIFSVTEKMSDFRQFDGCSDYCLIMYKFLLTFVTTISIHLLYGLSLSLY